MNWQEILTILIPLLYLTWIYNRIEKRFENVDKRFEKIENTLQHMDSRLSRLEGQFAERGNWEVREFRKTGTEGK